jgi:two-component system OmpR family sensor kinase
MFRSLYSKLAAVLAALFCLVGLSFVVVTLFATEMYQQEVNQKLNSKLAEQIVNAELLMQDRRVNQEALQEIFHMLMVINPSIEIYLLDPEGKILAFSASPGKVKRTRVDLRPVREWLGGKVTFPVFGDDPRNPDGKKIFTAARIAGQGGLQGYLYVILGGETYDSVVQKLRGSYILKLTAWMIFGGLLFALVAGLLLFASLTGRLKRLARVMDSFRNGEKFNRIQLPLKKPKNSGDEIDRLSATFKQMTQHIEAQMEQLRKSDASRRDLIANVSHDLRTPLATLQGYIETLLLKDNSLTVEQRRNYLEIAAKHCGRLSNLVNKLLELAKLDACQISVVREPFNLRELAQDVIQKFQLKAGEKDANISLVTERDLPFVNADIGLIERVLENLIENAIRYTPSGGTIRLVLTPRENDVAVQIIDSGCGIPNAELAHIFNRFYQSDKSRKGDPQHSGLGLAITKRILELHDRSIEVTSTLNQGTTFTFQLPAHLPA